MNTENKYMLHETLKSRSIAKYHKNCYLKHLMTTLPDK